MPDVWTCLIVATLPAVAVELLVLSRARRAWMSRSAHGAFAGVHEYEAGDRTAPTVPGVGPAHEHWFIGTPPAESAWCGTADAVLCFDPSGRCTAANAAGRRLLPRPDGENSLTQLLSGGEPAAARLLATLATEGVLERNELIVSEAASSHMHLRALALRDRDSNFWGAALFLRRTAAVTPEQSAADLSPR